MTPTTAASHDLRTDARVLLTGWRPADASQRALAAQYLAFLDAHEDAMWRRCRPGHLTASALVLDAERDRVLLTLHPKFGRWLQLGGHCEPDDPSLAAAALREAQEESGIDALRIRPQPLRLDRHRVGCHGGSWHYDVQFLALAPSDAQERCSAESLAVSWFAVDRLPGSCDASVRALVAAATDLG